MTIQLPRRDPLAVTSLSGALGDSRMHIGLPADQYHSDVDVQSCSLLKAMHVSPAHYLAQFHERHSTSKSRDFGSLVHTLVLEPGLFSREYAVYDGDGDARSAEFKAFKAANVGREVIDELTYARAKSLSEKVLSRTVRGRPFGDYVSEGYPEVSIYYTDPSTGVACRCRLDLLHPEFIFDLKTTQHAERDAWLRQGLSLHYDMQAYMYALAVALFFGHSEPSPFVFMAAESTAPFTVNVLTAGSTFLENGGRKYQAALSGYAACARVNHWPGPEVEDVVEIQHWQMAQSAPAWKEQVAQGV